MLKILIGALVIFVAGASLAHSDDAREDGEAGCMVSLMVLVGMALILAGAYPDA